jgi:hypothetical protein
VAGADRTRWARLALVLAAGVGWGVALAATVLLVASASHGIGEDSHAYWLAGARWRSGDPMYLASDLSELGAYRYVPAFAQAWAPLSLIPEVAIAWGWRFLGLLSIRYMAGSWLVAGIWMLVPGTLTELGAGNVTFQVSALTVAGLRGRAEGVIPAMVVKFSSCLVIPYIWACRPAARKRLLFGAAATAAVVGVSLLIDVRAWSQFWSSLLEQASFSFEGTPIIHILPAPGADYGLRLLLAAGLALAAVTRGSPHLAFIASVVATPILWPQRLSVLMALPTLQGDAWVRRLLAGPAGRVESTK